MKDRLAEKKYTKTHFGEMVYLDWNREAALGPIICIHGINRNKHDFDYLANRLVESNFRVITLDMLGRGESTYMRKELYTYENYKNILLELVNNLSLQNFALVGTSMGGIISMMVASEIPKKIDALVINDIGPYTDFSAMVILSKYLCMYPEFSSLAEAEKFLRVMLKPLNLQKEEHWQHMLRYSFRRNSEKKYVLDFDPEIFMGHREKITGARDLWEVWHSIEQNIPILVLRGELSRMLSKETLIKMTLSNRETSYIEYPDIGHAPSLLEPNQLEDVKTWLLSTYFRKKNAALTIL